MGGRLRSAILLLFFGLLQRFSAAKAPRKPPDLHGRFGAGFFRLTALAEQPAKALFAPARAPPLFAHSIAKITPHPKKRADFRLPAHYLALRRPLVRRTIPSLS